MLDFLGSGLSAPTERKNHKAQELPERFLELANLSASGGEVKHLFVKRRFSRLLRALEPGVIPTP